MPKLPHQCLQGFEGDGCTPKDTVNFPHVPSCLISRQTNSPFDAVKGETDHILRAGEVAISLDEFLSRDGFFAARVPGYTGLRKKGMNTMDGSPTNHWDVGPILGFCRGMTEVVDINLEESQGC